MPTLIFSRVGACPPCSPRAGAHDEYLISYSYLMAFACVFDWNFPQETFLQLKEKIGFFWKAATFEAEDMKSPLKSDIFNSERCITAKLRDDFFSWMIVIELGYSKKLFLKRV